MLRMRKHVHRYNAFWLIAAGEKNFQVASLRYDIARYVHYPLRCQLLNRFEEGWRGTCTRWIKNDNVIGSSALGLLCNKTRGIVADKSCGDGIGAGVSLGHGDVVFNLVHADKLNGNPARVGFLCRTDADGSGAAIRIKNPERAAAKGIRAIMACMAVGTPTVKGICTVMACVAVGTPAAETLTVAFLAYAENTFKRQPIQDLGLFGVSLIETCGPDLKRAVQKLVVHGRCPCEHAGFSPQNGVRASLIDIEDNAGNFGM